MAKVMSQAEIDALLCPMMCSGTEPEAFKPVEQYKDHNNVRNMRRNWKAI